LFGEDEGNNADGEAEAKTCDDKLEKLKDIRRNNMFELFLGHRFPYLTKPFVTSAIALICLPDYAAYQKGLLIVSVLLRRCAADGRFLTPVGRDAFCAGISVLLKEVRKTTQLASRTVY
jgi:hypothetical protein